MRVPQGATANEEDSMGMGRTAWRVTKRLSGAQVSTVEAAGMAHAIAGIHPTFDRSLLPRTTPQQAVITGVWGAVNYGLTATFQSLIEAGARRVGTGRLSSTHLRRASVVAADLAVMGAGLAIYKRVGDSQATSLRRAAVRTAGWRMYGAGLSGAIALAADGVGDIFTGNHSDRTVNAPVVIAAGAATAGGMYLWRTQRQIDTGVEVDQFGDDVQQVAGQRPLRAVVVGMGVSAMLFGVARTESVAAHAIGDVVARVAPGLAPYSHPLGHATVLGAAGVALGQVLSRVYGATEQAGSAIEPAYQAVPDSPNVSGGPISILDWQSFGREGRRFVNMALTSEQIEKVTGKPAQDPIRAFVGLDSAVSPNARAYLAREELENLGAFERSTIAVFAPTGTGYVNYVAAETLEYLTGGDVASVAVQYSVRPSFLSLDRVETAWESYLALLNGLSGRLRGMAPADRPRVLLFGESLGSLASQDVFAKGGVIGFDMLGIDRALFVGTPQASEWRNKWLADPAGVDPDGMVVEVSGLAEWVALPAEQRARARIVLLTHHNDPICKFGPSLAIQQPYWLGKPETRPPGVPHEVPFVPGLTFLQVGVDLLNADNVKPGTFEAMGHDYRADIAQMVRVAFDIDADPPTMMAVEKALRRREFEWAERRLVLDQLTKTESELRERIAAWGVDPGSLPNIVEAKRAAAEDPFAVTQPEE